MSHPTYQKMAITAIAALKDRTGSSMQAIKKAISAAYPALNPAAVSRSTNAALKKLVAAGTVAQTKGSYKLSAKATKKPAAKKKTAAKKTTAKKTAAKKKPAAKKTTAKKTAAKKEPAKKAAKKPAAKKSVKAKKPPAKKAAKKP